MKDGNPSNKSTRQMMTHVNTTSKKKTNNQQKSIKTLCKKDS
jgi:hypothetical protein